MDSAYLYRVLPRVYAVGHRATTTEAKLAAACVYAGPGSMLSHATAAWWVGLADSQPYMIDVSTPRQRLSIPRIRVHQRRPLTREWHRGLPVTCFTQTLLDYATQTSLSKLRRALARADYQRELNVAAIESALGRRAGSAKLRQALENHQPELAQARSGREIDLYELCESHGVPPPELSAEVAGWAVDALWRRERLVVEIDGPGNHRSPAQIRRDRRKEFEVRTAGFIILRYSDEQVVHRGALVMAEIERFRSQRA